MLRYSFSKAASDIDVKVAYIIRQQRLARCWTVCKISSSFQNPHATGRTTESMSDSPAFIKMFLSVRRGHESSSGFWQSFSDNTAFSVLPFRKLYFDVMQYFLTLTSSKCVLLHRRFLVSNNFIRFFSGVLSLYLRSLGRNLPCFHYD